VFELFSTKKERSEAMRPKGEELLSMYYVIEEAVEEHHHGSGPDTWGINSAARIVNQGKGRMLPEF